MGMQYRFNRQKIIAVASEEITTDTLRPDKTDDNHAHTKNTATTKIGDVSDEDSTNFGDKSVTDKMPPALEEATRSILENLTHREAKILKTHFGINIETLRNEYSCKDFSKTEAGFPQKRKTSQKNKPVTKNSARYPLLIQNPTTRIGAELNHAFNSIIQSIDEEQLYTTKIAWLGNVEILAFLFVNSFVEVKLIKKKTQLLTLLFTRLKTNLKGFENSHVPYKTLGLITQFFDGLKYSGQIVPDSGKDYEEPKAEPDDNPTETGEPDDNLDVNGKKANGMEAIIKKFIDELRDLPEAQQQEAYELFQEFTAKAAAEPKDPTPITSAQPEMPYPKTKAEMKALGMETYKEFTKRTGEANGKACLLQHWARWLKDSKNAPDREHLCQADLRKDDEPLIARLRTQFSTSELKEFLPIKWDITKQEAKNISIEEAREMSRKSRLVGRHAKIA